MEQAGLASIINKYHVKVIDLDFEETEEIIFNGEEHYIPKCFKVYGIRIGLPATSKREGMVFSNNVKLFVGAVPRRMYQIDNKVVDWRPRVHLDLRANIFGSIRYIRLLSYLSMGVSRWMKRRENSI